MKYSIALVTLPLFCAGCPSAEPQPQTFCVQFVNITGFANEGGRTVTFQVFDARSSTTPLTYMTTVNGSPFQGSSFTIDAPADISDAFASEVIEFTGVPPINFEAAYTGVSAASTCAIPQVSGIGGELFLGRDVWRIEATGQPALSCLNDQGPCD